MNEFTLYILTAVALVFVLEGALYALFPDFIRKIMATAIMMPVEKLRLFGLGMAALGVLIVWVLQSAGNA